MIDIHERSSTLVDELNKHGSASERDFTIGGDTYKPFYRALSLIIDYWREPVTIEEAEKILVRAHPFFVEAIDRDREMFECLYKFHREAWE